MKTISQNEQAVWDALLTVDQALVQKDAESLRGLLSNDFVGTTPVGLSLSKNAYVQHHCGVPWGLLSIAEEDIEAATIRLFDQTAVVNRKVHTHFKLPTGAIVEYDVQRLEALAYVNGQWIMVSGQGTQVLPVQQPA